MCISFTRLLLLLLEEGTFHICNLKAAGRKPEGAPESCGLPQFVFYNQTCIVFSTDKSRILAKLAPHAVISVNFTPYFVSTVVNGMGQIIAASRANQFTFLCPTIKDCFSVCTQFFIFFSDLHFPYPVRLRTMW